MNGRPLLLCNDMPAATKWCIFVYVTAGSRLGESLVAHPHSTLFVIIKQRLERDERSEIYRSPPRSGTNELTRA